VSRPSRCSEIGHKHLCSDAQNLELYCGACSPKKDTHREDARTVRQYRKTGGDGVRQVRRWRGAGEEGQRCLREPSVTAGPHQALLAPWGVQHID
jgi:hypothetical protein